MAAPAPRALLVALAVAGLTGSAALAGCGADTEGDAKAQADARKVVERFGTATAQRDYQTICDELLADSLVQKLENVGLPCEVAFRKGVGAVRDPRLEVRQVSVQGDRALVSVRSTATGEPPSNDAVELVRQDGGWRIASLVQAGGGQATTGTTATATTTAPAATTTAPAAKPKPKPKPKPRAGKG